MRAVVFRGLQLGLLYKPTSVFRIGINYRSAVRVRTEGKQKIDGVSTRDDAEVDYDLPHKIQIGAAHSFLESKLTIATDLSYWMYSQSHKSYGWRDALSMNMGAEYWVHESVPLRVGTFVGRSATSDAAIGPFVPSNGPTTGVTIGSGLRLNGWTCDVGLAFVYATKDNKINDPQGGTFAGKHEFSQNAFVASLTVGYGI